MPLTGLEIILIPTVSGIVGIAVGKVWGKNGTVTMERCSLLTAGIKDKLESIETKLDKISKNSNQ